MNEARQKELKELLAKHSQQEQKAKSQDKKNDSISVSNINGDNNNIYINSYVTEETAKKN